VWPPHLPLSRSTKWASCQDAATMAPSDMPARYTPCRLTKVGRRRSVKASSACGGGGEGQGLCGWGGGPGLVGPVWPWCTGPAPGQAPACPARPGRPSAPVAR
jgi:hypothetical protein